MHFYHKLAVFCGTTEGVDYLTESMSVVADHMHITCDCDVIHKDIVENVLRHMPCKPEFLKISELFKMFSDGTRLQILWALESSEMCVCDLAVLLNMTKSAISHQLKSLRLTNLVKSRREGKVVFYSLVDSHVKDILDMGFAHVSDCAKKHGGCLRKQIG